MVTSADSLLQVSGLSKSFRGLHALEDYHLHLQEGELLGVIGPNGAGKTTLFNLLTGVVAPSAGNIVFAGQEVAGRRVEEIARLGIARTFQKIRLFAALSALENVRVALQSQERVNLVQVLLSLPRFGAAETKLTAQARALLDELGILDAADLPAERLSYNQQRRLEMACALALAPRLLLLDEPMAGMNATETDALMNLVLELHHRHRIAIILIEHNMRVIMESCQRIQALNYGRIIGEGTPDEIRRDPRVVEAYLGQAGSAALDRIAAV